jgi:hypothetical protein
MTETARVSERAGLSTMELGASMDGLGSSARGWRSRLSLELATAAFIAFVCLTLIGVEGWRIISARTTALGAGMVNAQNLTRSLSRNVASTLRSADAILADLVERLENDRGGPAERARLRRLLMANTAAFPLIDDIAVFGERGDARVSSLPPGQATSNIFDHDYFNFHRDHSDHGLHVGHPVQSKATGHWIIPVSRRIDHADGTFAGIIRMAVSLDSWRRFYQVFDVGESGTITVYLARSWSGDQKHQTRSVKTSRRHRFSARGCQTRRKEATSVQALMTASCVWSAIVGSRAIRWCLRSA